MSKFELKKYEIWIGDHHLGQGYDPPTQPQKLDEIEAPSFKIACFIYELKSNLRSIEDRIARQDTYIEDIHFGTLYYNPEINGNSWTGKYFETREDALKSFK